MAVEFICEGCGYTVFDVIAEKAPPHQLCHTCTFLCEHYGAEGMRVYDFIHGRQSKKEKPLGT